LRLERVQRPLEVADNVLALPRPLEQDPEVLDLSRERIAELQVLAQTATTLQDLLCIGLILPEVRRADTFLETRDLVADAGSVKDSSANPERVSGDLANAEPDPR